MKKRTFLTTAAAVAGAGWSGHLWAQPKPINIKFDSYVTETAGPSYMDEWFLKELEKRSEGAVKVRRYWAQSLNKVGEHLAAVRDGTSEMSLITPQYYHAQLPVTRGLDWYYRCNRADALHLVCRDIYDRFEPLRDEWEKRYGIKVMYWTNWYYAPLFTRTPIKSLEDIRGKRFRGVGAANDVITRLGGTAIPMAAPEVYTALERGVLDGVSGFDFLSGVAYKLHEIAPHITSIGDGAHAATAVGINMRVWNKFPDSIKNICQQLVQEIYGGKYTEIYTDTAQRYVKTVLKEGGTFSALSDAEIAKARTLVQPAQTQQWIDNVAKPAGIDGSRMQSLIDALIAKYDPQAGLKRPDELALELA